MFAAPDNLVWGFNILGRCGMVFCRETGGEQIMISRRMLLMGAVALPVVALLPVVARTKALKGWATCYFEHHITLQLYDGTHAQYNRYNLAELGNGH